MTTPRRCHVVVIEDSADIREALQEVLTDEGYSVSVASNGLEGYKLLSAIRRPCLILLDWVMPVVDGREFLVRLRADPTLAALPVLVLTACTIDPAPQGVQGLLYKPMDLDVLLAAIDRHCPAVDAFIP
ncbi:response regulator [Myxococcus sp. Y35]|uniref:response regulator n=1 Tax=Pseudomyxococcus flavus TaxID=3115648 RepID=UPI003CE948F0